MRDIRAAAILLIVVPSAVLCAADEREPMGLPHLELLRGVGGGAIAPDGKRVAVTLSRSDPATNKRTTELLLVSVDDGSIETVGEGSSPRWSPDGAWLAYLEDGETRGIRLYELATREGSFLVPVESSNHFLGHRSTKSFAWSPKGTHIAFVGAEPEDPAAAEPASDVRVVERMLYKSRTEFSDNRKTHVWVVPVTGDDRGKARLLTPGSHDEHSIGWSPDGTRIVFMSDHSADPDDGYRDDLWSVDVASGEVKRICDTPGTELRPAWSPRGNTIAYLANVRPRNTKDSSPENTHIHLLDLDSGQSRNLTAALDRRVRSFRWHPDGGSIYFTADDRGNRNLYRVSTDSENTITEVHSGEHQVRSFSIDGRGQRFAFLKGDLVHPTEVWIADGDGRGAHPVTSFNRPLLQKVEVVPARSFWFESWDRTPVQGWLMRPAGFQEDVEYPLILWVHGGPHGMYGASFSERFQLLTGNGYGVLFINPRGSTGYGQAFADGCVRNWGGGDYQDLMAGVDHVLETSDWIDAERLGVAGGSYGGFMTNWIITRTPRFKAAVSIASVSNLISFYGTSLYQLLIEVEFNGRPWDNYPLLWQWSPLAHVAGVSTPTLFLHGENDHDVPITQAEEMFMALKKLGVETVLVRYPNEGHGFQEPHHRLDYYRRTLEWFDRYLK